MTMQDSRISFFNEAGQRITSFSTVIMENVNGARVTALHTDVPLGYLLEAFFVDEGSDYYLADAGVLKLQADRHLDFEGTGGRTALVHAIFSDLSGTRIFVSLPVSIIVEDVDEAPTSMDLSTDSLSLPEGPQQAQKIADIVFDDDAIGRNEATIGDSDIFEIRNGTELWVKDGAILNFEEVSNYQVTIQPDVTGVGPTLSQVTFTLNVLDVQLTAEDITIGTTARPNLVQAHSNIGAKVGEVPIRVNHDIPVLYEVIRDGQVSRHFYVDSQGALRIKASLADESVDNVDLLIRAHSGGEIIEQTVSFAINSGYHADVIAPITGFQGRTASFSGGTDRDGDTYELGIYPGGARRIADGSFETRFQGQIVTSQINGKLSLDIIRQDKAIFTPDPDFIGTKNITFTLIDSRGDSSRVTISFEIQPELLVTEAQSSAVEWDAINLHSRPSTAGSYIEFTRLPTTGRFVLLDETGSKTPLTVGMQIHARQVAAGLLKYEAPESIDTATYETAHFVTHLYFNSGLVRTKSELFTIAISDTNGQTSSSPTGSIALVPMLVSNKISLGTTEIIHLDIFGAHSSLDLANLSNVTFRFTSLPESGHFQIANRNDTITIVSSSTIIQATDVEQGRLSFVAGTANSDVNVVETQYIATRTDTHGNHVSTSLRLDLQIEEFYLRDKYNVGAQRDENYVWDGASDIRFIEIGGKLIISATGADDNRTPLLEFSPNIGQLRYFKSFHGVDGWRFSNMEFSQMILHNEIAGMHYSYVTDLSGYTGIYGFRINPNGSTTTSSGPGNVIAGNVNTNVAIRDIWSPTIVEFDDHEYLITSGSESSGLSVFRFEDTGALTHLSNVSAPVTAGSERFALTGSVRGKVVKLGEVTYFIGTAEDNDAVVVYRVASNGSVTFTHAIRDNEQLALDKPMISDIMTIGDKTFVAVPSFAEDAVQILEISATGQLTPRHRINDSDSAVYNLDGAGVVKFFTHSDQHYLAVAGFHDDGISIFRMSANGAPLLVQTVNDDAKRNLDGIDGLDVHQTDDGRIFMAASGYHDDGFSVFEIMASNEVLPSTVDII